VRQREKTYVGELDSGDGQTTLRQELSRLARHEFLPEVRKRKGTRSISVDVRLVSSKGLDKTDLYRDRLANDLSDGLGDLLHVLLYSLLIVVVSLEERRSDGAGSIRGHNSALRRVVVLREKDNALGVGGLRPVGSFVEQLEAGGGVCKVVESQTVDS
jgi:hypothetical protein